jgi:hypothetical protein
VPEVRIVERQRETALVEFDAAERIKQAIAKATAGLPKELKPTPPLTRTTSTPSVQIAYNSPNVVLSQVT